MDGRVFREHRFHVWQFRLLLIAGERHPTPAVGSDTLFECRVVERAAAPQDFLKLPLLFGRRLEFVLVGFAYALLV